VEFIEAPAFTTHLARYLDDEGYTALQLHLANEPEAGAVIAGTGGFRKIRWADQRRQKGKRGGLRIIYYYFSPDTQIWLMTLYDKSEATDLSAAEKRILKAAIEREIDQRAQRRARRRR